MQLIWIMKGVRHKIKFPNFSFCVALTAGIKRFYKKKIKRYFLKMCFWFILIVNEILFKVDC